MFALKATKLQIGTSDILRENILSIYALLNKHFGNLHWWPAETPFEVIVGAILTQNTAWTNVETAINNLKVAGLMSPHQLRQANDSFIESLITPSGYYRQKTKKLKAFLKYLCEQHQGNVDTMIAMPTNVLRNDLLSIWGIGQETADSIILYALQKPLFVVDAYTKRILLRHQMCSDNADYGDIQRMFMLRLQPNVKMFQQYHALLVNTGKLFCKKTIPSCTICPLQCL
ncbi:MAG: endonuclease III domain-containing protein [Deltaproteobacteria bacterium]